MHLIWCYEEQPLLVALLSSPWSCKQPQTQATAAAVIRQQYQGSIYAMSASASMGLNAPHVQQHLLLQAAAMTSESSSS
jgi:hypothetical protein